MKSKPNWLSLSLLTLCSLCLCRTFSFAADAVAVLKANCYRCHGQDGSREGGFGAVLDVAVLHERKLIVPGDAGQSKLFRRVAKGQMPPADESPRPSPDDVATLKAWIEAGAPAPTVAHASGSETLTNGQLFSLILTDLERLDRRSRRFQRYFTLAPLARAGMAESALQAYRLGLAKLLNSLSWHPQVAELHRVDAAGLILRVDLRDLLWDNTLWTRLLAEYPYGIVEDSGAFRAVAANAATRLPVIRVDWFLATASRPPLYYDLLQLPTTAGELERQLRIDAAADIRQERVARAGFNGSGVSRNNRLIERHVGPSGAYWRTYDFDAVPQTKLFSVTEEKAQPDRRNLFAYPLGPGNTDNVFRHAGGEIIWHLPNGLLGFMLVNANDVRIDKAPTAIVSDPRRPDRAVEPGVSCMSCHLGGIQMKADRVREHVAKNPTAYSKPDAEIVRVLYPSETDMTKLMTADAERFKTALEKIGGKDNEPDPVSASAVRYEADLDLRNAAAEVGLSPQEWRNRISGSETLARNFGPFRADGGTVHRSVWQQGFADLIRELRLGTLTSATLTGNLPDNTGDLDPLEGPSTQTNAAAFSPDRRFVLLASADRSVRLLEVASGRELRRFVGHSASVWSVAWSPDGKKALSGALDGTVRLWDVATGQELRRIDAHEGLVSAVAFFSDGQRALSAGFDHTVVVWDLESGAEIKRIGKLGSVVHCAAVSPDGKTAAAGGDPLVWLIDLTAGKVRRRFTGHGSAVVAVAIDADGRRLGTAADDGLVRTWDLERGEGIGTFNGHPGGAKAVAFLGKDIMVTATGAGDLLRWDTSVRTATTCTSYSAHAAAVAGIAVLNNGHDIASAGRNSTIRVWQSTPVRAGGVSDGPNSPSLTPPARSDAPSKLIASVELNGTLAGPRLSPDGRWLYILNHTTNRLAQFDATTLKEVHSTSVPDGSVYALSFDGKSLYVGSPSQKRNSAGRLWILDAATLSGQRSITKMGEPFDLAAGGNGRIFASGVGTGWSQIAVLDAAAGKEVTTWGGVWAKSFIAQTPDGSRLLTSTQSVTPGRLEAWPLTEPITDKPEAYAAPAEAKVGGPIVVTSDGRFVLCSTGTVLRLAPKGSEDLQPVANVGAFQAAAADPDHGIVYLLREDGALDTLSYPEFKLRSSHRTGIAAYGIALDAKAGRLYVAGIPLAALRERPKAKAIGDLLVFDVGPLTLEKQDAK